MFNKLKATWNYAYVAMLALTWRWSEHDSGDAPVFAELLRCIEEDGNWENNHV